LASLPMPRCAFYGLFIVSGFAGLIYESIWAQYLKLFLGHAAYAQSLVLAVFMGGMAVGAAAAGRFSERLVNPLLVYGRVGVLIAWAGLPGTLRTAGILNLLIAATVWLLARPAHHAPLRSERSGADAARALLAVAFFTGLASFVYEIGWIRMLSLVLGASTHS